MPTQPSLALRFTRTSIALVVAVAAIAATARAQSPANPWGAKGAEAAGRHADVNGISCTTRWRCSGCWRSAASAEDLAGPDQPGVEHSCGSARLPQD
jgi:hypothetical protein